MPLQNFVSYQGNIPATWLNAIDAFYVTLFSSATTASAARTALGLGTIATENTAAITADLVMSSAGIIEAEGAAVASATTTDIWTTDGNTRHITGTTTITSFGTAPQAGAWMKVIFDGALTLTHGANLSLPGSANITTAADDFAFVYADTTTQFDVLYFKKDGSPVVTGSASTLTGTTLAANVVTSSLTSVGTIAGLTTTGVLSKDKCASIYQYTAWDPSDVTGTLTTAPATAGATSAATGYITVANSGGTTTWTNVKTGLYRFTVTMYNEGTASGTRMYLQGILGGTATILLGVPTTYSIHTGETSAGNRAGGTFTFYATMTATQTVTVQPQVAAISSGATTDFTTQCTVAAEYVGT